MSLNAFLIEALTQALGPRRIAALEGGAMTPPDLARTLDAVANQMQVVAGLTTALRRSVTADAQTVIDLDGAVDRVVQVLRDLQPKTSENT